MRITSIFDRSQTPSRLLVWSADDEADDEAIRLSLRRRLRARGDGGFGRLAEARASAGPGPVRGALVASSAQDALAALDGARPGAFLGRNAGPNLPVGVLLPGQGAQHARMAVGLYQREPVVTAALEEVFTQLGDEGDRVRFDWLAEVPVLPIDHPARALPLLFALDYALGRLLLAWGVRPSVLLGQGVGELAAAALAGVLTLPDAVRVLRAQADQLGRAPAGGLVAVAAGADEVGPYLPGEVVVAAENGPGQTVIAGPEDQLAMAARALDAAGLACLRVRAGTAYHSPVVAEACVRAGSVLAEVPLLPPEIPVLSTATAAPVRPDQAVDPGFWARQPAAPVRLWPAVDTLFANGEHLCVEAGPGQGMAALVRRHPAVARGGSQVHSLLAARPRNGEHDRRSVLLQAARMWTAGHDLDLAAVQRLTDRGAPSSTDVAVVERPPARSDPVPARPRYLTSVPGGRT
ncbi:MAG TPA: acyltransferase domain-containing protein [Mycobacteriales bacterium]|nr:acyltransferase domain-containing protein [Mycobacteriales bacterium]